MIIIKKEYGQLGNRLHTHANILAWCIQNNHSLLNLSFRKFSQYFKQSGLRKADFFIQEKSLLKAFLCSGFLHYFIDKLCMSKKWLSRLSSFVQLISLNDNETLDEKRLNQLTNCNKKFTVIHCWDVRCAQSLSINANKIREILTPNKYSVDNATAYMKDLKLKCDTIIGVHARRGDYKQYLGGKYFHSWKSYKEWISQAKDLFESEDSSRKIGFLLCSDEIPKKHYFDSLPVYIPDFKGMMSDLHALSICDYSMGPPSSFGTWYSWYGKVPRCILEHNTRIKSIGQFVVCQSC